MVWSSIPVPFHNSPAVISRGPSTADQRARRLAPVDVPLPLLAVTVLAPVLVGAFFWMDAVVPVEAFYFVGAAFLAAAFLAAAFLDTAFFGAAFFAAVFFAAAFLDTTFFGAAFFAAVFFAAVLFGTAFLGAAFLGAAFFGAALLGADGPDGTADGASSPDEASTVTVPGPGITIVSSCEGQRTRSIDPTSAVTTPSRSGPFPDARRIR